MYQCHHRVQNDSWEHQTIHQIRALMGDIVVCGLNACHYKIKFFLKFNEIVVCDLNICILRKRAFLASVILGYVTLMPISQEKHIFFLLRNIVVCHL